MTAVLITGATGKQGGSLIKSLISRNAPFEILAVTRNPTSPSAQKLRNLSPSIKLVEGDLDNPAKIFQNAQRLTPSPIWGVYSVQVSNPPCPPPKPTLAPTSLTPKRQQSETTQKKVKANHSLTKLSSKTSSSSSIALSTAAAKTIPTLTLPKSPTLSKSTTSSTTSSTAARTPPWSGQSYDQQPSTRI